MTTESMNLQEIYDLAKNTLKRNGCNDQNANAVSKIIQAAEQDGSTSHGLFRLPGYIKALKSGKVNGNAVPKIIEKSHDEGSFFNTLKNNGSRKNIVSFVVKAEYAFSCKALDPVRFNSRTKLSTLENLVVATTGWSRAFSRYFFVKSRLTPTERSKP